MSKEKKTVNREAHIAAIRAACRLAKLSAEKHFCCKYQTTVQDNFCDHCVENSSSFRLAEILLAINKAPEGFNDLLVSARGHFYKKNHYTHKYTSLPEKWDLFKDSLEDQSDETIAFLYSLLNNEK